jgi:hypothetical protein
MGRSIVEHRRTVRQGRDVALAFALCAGGALAIALLGRVPAPLASHWQQLALYEHPAPRAHGPTTSPRPRAAPALVSEGGR